MTTPLRVGLIGWGYASATFHAPLIAATPGLQLAAVSSSDPERARRGLAALAASGPHPGLPAPGSGLPEVLADAAALIAHADIDLVVIPTPNDTHHPLARDALRAGRHVVVDKPFTLDAAQARELVSLAAAQDRLLSVFHNRRWDGDFLTARQLLSDGRLGTVTDAALSFDRFRPRVRDRWREGAGPGAGIWMDLGPHLLDQALRLFGWPQAMQGDIAALRPDAVSDDHFQVRLRYGGGLRVTLAASMLMALPRPRFALHGTLGSWVKSGLDAQEDRLKAGRVPDPGALQAFGADPNDGLLAVAAAPGAEPQAVAWPTRPGRYADYYAGVRDALHGLQPNPVPAAQALQVMTLLDLGRESHRLRCELPVPEDPAV